MSDAGKLARARLEIALRNLKIKYSEFLYPLSSMELVERAASEADVRMALSTDGLRIYYSPDNVINKYIEVLEYEIMHIIMHGMLGHFLRKDDFPEKAYRDAAMDLQVVFLLDKMGVSGIRGVCPANYELGYVENHWNNDYSMGNYYRALENEAVAYQLVDLGRNLKRDEHEQWDLKKEKGQEKALDRFWKLAIGSIVEIEDGEASSIEGLFGKLAGRISAYGSEKGDGEAAFQLAEGETSNYKKILKDLLRSREFSKEEPDSIDPMLYSYGLELYGDVPLIEPLETCDKPSLHTLAIAVDVSGSCTFEEVMGQFWRETYECISQIKEETEAGEILLIQCDSEIQNVKRILLEDFNEKPEKVSINGMGGTSFVPVFKYLDQRIREGEIIDALIYLTDGEGAYPDKKTDYPTYFVMPKEQRDVPKWMRVKMPDWLETIYLE